MIKSEKRFHFVGLFLFVAYLIQYFFELHWQPLVRLQQQEWYKLGSGVLLLLLILLQWYFSRVRANPKVSASKAVKHKNLHIWAGAFSPLVFYLHAVGPGYAYLLLLSVLFFGNLLLGMLNQESVQIKSQWYFRGWMILHISISCLITALVLVHISMVVYYT